MVITRVIFLYGLSEELWFNSFFFPRFQKKKHSGTMGVESPELDWLLTIDKINVLCYFSLLSLRKAYFWKALRDTNISANGMSTSYLAIRFCVICLILVYFVNWSVKWNRENSSTACKDQKRRTWFKFIARPSETVEFLIAPFLHIRPFKLTWLHKFI